MDLLLERTNCTRNPLFSHSWIPRDSLPCRAMITLPLFKKGENFHWVPILCCLCWKIIISQTTDVAKPLFFSMIYMKTEMVKLKPGRKQTFFVLSLGTGSYRSAQVLVGHLACQAPQSLTAGRQKTLTGASWLQRFTRRHNTQIY